MALLLALVVRHVGEFALWLTDLALCHLLTALYHLITVVTLCHLCCRLVVTHLAIRLKWFKLIFKIQKLNKQYKNTYLVIPEWIVRCRLLTIIFVWMHVERFAGSLNFRNDKCRLMRMEENGLTYIPWLMDADWFLDADWAVDADWSAMKHVCHIHRT